MASAVRSPDHPPSCSCSSCPAPDKYAPAPAPAVHFNALGELIPYVVIPELRGLALVPAPENEHPNAGDDPKEDTLAYPDTDPDDLDDMELAYPDDEPSEPAPPAPPSSSPGPSPATFTSISAPLPPPPTPSTRAPLPLPPRRPPSSRTSVPRPSKLPIPLTDRSSSSSSSSSISTPSASASISAPAPSASASTSAPAPSASPSISAPAPTDIIATLQSQFMPGRHPPPGRLARGRRPRAADAAPPAPVPFNSRAAVPGAGLMLPPPLPAPSSGSGSGSGSGVPHSVAAARTHPPRSHPHLHPHPHPHPEQQPHSEALMQQQAHLVQLQEQQQAEQRHQLQQRMLQTQTPQAQVGCATAGCGGLVAARGRRCLVCVRGSWAGRKDSLGAKAAGAEAVEVPVDAEKVKRRAQREWQRKEKQRARAVELMEWERERERIKAGGTETGTPDGKERVTIKLRVTPKGVEKKVRFELEEDKKGKRKAVTEGDADMDTEAKPKDDGSEGAGPWDGAGWDSELSDLTNSSDGESEIEEAPRPSLKIRIPARSPAKPSAPVSASPASGSGSTSTPAAASVLPTPLASTSATPEAAPRLCTIARCRLPLPPFALYRWKCCSSCRKQYREYQRARLGRIALTNAEASATADAAAVGPAGPNGTPPRALYRARPKHTAEEEEALRAHAARKEWEREENRRALEVAGAPVGSRKLYREPWEKAKDKAKAKGKGKEGEREEEGLTWGAVLAAKAQRPVEGARICTGRGCEHVIPAGLEYEGTMCGGCLGRERRLAERTLVKEGKLPPPVPGAAQDPKDDFPVVKDPKPGRCMYADCGISMSVDAGVSETTCEQCVRRLTATQRRLPGRPPGARNKPKLKVPGETLTQQPVASPEKPLEAPKKRKRSSPYPTYQCIDALLKDFGTRFHDFIEAQSYYFLLRGGVGPQPPAEAMFDFSGEYSVVAADLDVVARKAQIELCVHDVKDAVARAGGLEFSPTSWVSILGKPGGVVTRFACVHLVNVFLPIRVPPGHPPNPAHPKSMQGELEVAVLPDDSHKYFAGEKTIVRFRLVG